MFLFAEVLGDGLAAGEDRDVLKHRLAAIAESGCLHGSRLQRPPQLVDNQRRERLAIDILRDDEQRAAQATCSSTGRIPSADLLLVNQTTGFSSTISIARGR